MYPTSAETLNKLAKQIQDRRWQAMCNSAGFAAGAEGKSVTCTIHAAGTSRYIAWCEGHARGVQWRANNQAQVVG